MTRVGKQEERRNRYPRRRKNPAKKTGPLKDNLPAGFKEHDNAIEGDLEVKNFIPKIK